LIVDFWMGGVDAGTAVAGLCAIAGNINAAKAALKHAICRVVFIGVILILDLGLQPYERSLKLNTRIRSQLCGSNEI